MTKGVEGDSSTPCSAFGSLHSPQRHHFCARWASSPQAADFRLHFAGRTTRSPSAGAATGVAARFSAARFCASQAADLEAQSRFCVPGVTAAVVGVAAGVFAARCSARCSCSLQAAGLRLQALGAAPASGATASVAASASIGPMAKTAESAGRENPDRVFVMPFNLTTGRGGAHGHNCLGKHEIAAHRPELFGLSVESRWAGNRLALSAVFRFR